MIVRTTSPLLHELLGIFLPLITTNCAVLGVALLNLERQHGFVESLVFGAAAAAGFGLALLLFAGAARAHRHGRRARGVPRHADRAGHRRADVARLHGLHRPRRTMNGGTLLPAIGWRPGSPSSSAPRSARVGCAAAPAARPARRADRRAAAADPVRPVRLSRLPALRRGDRRAARRTSTGARRAARPPCARSPTLLGREPRPVDPQYGVDKPRLVALIDEDRCIGCACACPACPVDAIVGAPR